MAINWDILFAHNQGRAAVDNVSTLLQQMADRDQKDRIANAGFSHMNADRKQKAYEYDTTGKAAAEAATRRDNAAADYTSQLIPSQERQQERQNTTDIYKAELQAQTKAQEESTKQAQWEYEQQQKAEIEGRKYNLDVDKFGLDKEKALQDKLKAQQDLQIKQQGLLNEERRTSAYEQQVANQKQTSWVDALFGNTNKTDVKPLSRSIDGSPYYSPPGTVSNNPFILS